MTNKTNDTTYQCRCAAWVEIDGSLEYPGGKDV